MDCNKLRKQLNFYVEGNLDDAFCRELEKHLESCSECAQEWRKTQKLFHFLKSMPVQKAPVYFEAQLNQRLDSEQTKPWSWITNWIPVFSGRSLQYAALTLCFVIISGAAVIFMQGDVQDQMTSVPAQETPSSLTEDIQKHLAGLSYASYREGIFQFPDTPEDATIVYDSADMDPGTSTGSGFQPVNYVEVNF